VIRVGESRQRGLSLLCRLLGYSRQAYYQRLRECERDELAAMVVVTEVVRIRSQQQRIGVRKLHYMLGAFLAQHSIVMGRDTMFDVLRDNGLLVRRRRRKAPRTTYSGFWMKRYPNLAREFVPDAPNQMWVSDITYIRVGEGFGYLSLITDAYSRKIVGWHLRRDLSSLGCLAALRMAVKDNADTQSLIHHSDRGLQYYGSDYRKLLERNGIHISMSEKSDPLENAIAERVNGILKQELLEARFGDLTSATKAIAEAVGTYNNLRPHLSIDMLTPAAAHILSGDLKRRWKNYNKWSGQPVAVHPTAYAAG
jgi:putative transposase